MRVVNLDKLTDKENRILNEVAVEIRNDFNNLVESVGIEHENNIDWIVSSIASRNKYMSPLFLRCCYLVLIKKLIEPDQNISEIVLSDQSLSKVLKTFFANNKIEVSVICHERSKSRLKRIFKPFYNFVNACVLLSLRYLGRSRIYTKMFHSVTITLLDTFVINSKIGDGGSIYKGKYRDRYYPGLLENLDEKEKENIFYYPSITGFKNAKKAFNLIRKAKEQFIIPDDFLKISDYLFILLHPLRILYLGIPKTSFLGFDVTSILRQERFLNCCNNSSFRGLLNYRFAFRTAQEKVSIKLLIDWYENQVIDRGMIVGFRRFHPETNITGYQGYIISKTLHIYIFPTPSEFRSQAVPHRIGVVGKGLLKDIQEFSDDFEAIVAPAFRFSKVWERRKRKPKPNTFTILVALPIGLEGAAQILKLIVSVYDKFKKSDFRFWIKPHPVYGQEQVKHLLNGIMPGNFNFKSGDFNICLEGANLLIGNASSTCLESMTKGVPVIIIGSCNGIIENPIPNIISEKIWKIAYTPEELSNYIEYFFKLNKKQIEELSLIGEKIKEEYFEPVTKENVRKFLRLN